MRLSQRLKRHHSADPASSVAELEAEAGRFEAEGRLVDAVDRLAAANALARDGAREVRLRHLRFDAAHAQAHGDGRADWPPRYADPFPTIDGLPEIDGRDLTTERVGGAVAHHGAVIVRGLFDPDQVERSVRSIDRAQASLAAAPEDGDGPDEWYRPMPVATPMRTKMDRSMVARQGGIWLGDSPAATEQVLGDLAAAGAVDVIAEHFGERPYFSLQKSTLRRSQPEYRLAAWHQDGSFLSPGVRTMNVWVALSPCGGTLPAPGLEVLPRRFEDVLPLEGIVAKHSISFDLVDQLAEETPTVIPTFAAGDAMMFDERLVHRTHFAEHMDQVRYAIECWFFAPSHQSESYDPLVV